MRAPTIDTTVLLVDDEPGVTDALGTAMELEGFTVRVAHRGDEGLDAFSQANPDVVVLDVALPDASGIDVAEAIRRQSPVPILMISGHNSEVEVIAALEAGADDYLVKPFGVAELVARIRAALRRASPARPAQELIQVGILTVAAGRGRVWLRGQALSLPDKEFALLEALVRNPDRVVTRASLVRGVWGADGSVTNKALDAAMRRLRQKLGTSAGTITTVRGVGFRFEPPT